MFKILNELVEIPINDRLIPADRRTRGGHNQAYKHIRAKTTLGQNSFWHQNISCHRIQNCGSIQESAGRLDLPASFPPFSLILHNRGLLEYSLKLKVKYRYLCLLGYLETTFGWPTVGYGMTEN